MYGSGRGLCAPPKAGGPESPGPGGQGPSQDTPRQRDGETNKPRLLDFAEEEPPAHEPRCYPESKETPAKEEQGAPSSKEIQYL